MYKGLKPTPMNVYKGTPIAASSKVARKEKKPDLAKHDKSTVREEHISDEFNMCAEPKRKKSLFDDNKDDIMRSCLDLEIDG